MDSQKTLNQRLCEAAKEGNEEAVLSALAQGAEINEKDDDWTPLMYASSYDYPDTVKLLLEHGAAIDARTKENNTALFFASVMGYDNIVRLLLERDAAIDAKDNNGDTALMVASRLGHLDTVLALLEAGADIEAKNNNQETALWIANEREQTEVASLLESVLEKRQLLQSVSTEAGGAQAACLHF